LFLSERQENSIPSKATTCGKYLFQLRVLGFGSDEDGNVRASVFPQREQIRIGRVRLGGVSLQDIGAGEAEMRECGDGLPRRKLTRTFPTRDSH
jgi:hypothetical protein